MKFSVRRQDDAVSEIIGTILLISIVVIAASVIAVAVFSQPQPQKIPSLSAVISNQSQIVYIKHNGGDALPNGTFKVLVDGIDVTSSVIIPTTWSIGEMLTYSKPGTTPPSSVAIVYTGSGSAGVVLSSAYFVQYAGGGSPTGTMTATATPTPTPTPSVTGISPTAGPTAGGTSVTITGTSFTGATSVSFGGTAATSYTVNSATSITATSPADSAGTVDITVTTAKGTSATSAADHYSYAAPPAVTGISPTSGSTFGGTSVTITGTGFTGTTSVSFGGTATSSYTVNSATSITATSPAGSAGTVDITVTTPGGTSATSAADHYAYVVVPVITGISPAAGATGGGTSVTITGTGFTGATAVAFGSLPAQHYTVNSATSITAVSPNYNSAGTVDITITTSNGTSATSSSDQFTFGNPTVTGISPSAGPIAGGTSVTITGTGFTGVTKVMFGSTAAISYTVNNATSITTTAPSGSGTVDVKVTNTAGQSLASSADQFIYVAAPAVTGISPTAGPTAGGTSVTITGTGFTGATAITFGGTAAPTYTVNSATSITVTSPANPAGTVDVTVTTPGGTSATSSVDKYTYATAPAVTGILPIYGSTLGGTSVAITGSGFTGATAVTFGSTAVTSFAVISSTSITATSPAGSAGTVDVTVTTPGGASATSAADQFTYIPPPNPNFTGTPLTGTTPLTVQFTDTSTGTPTSWAWSFGDSSSLSTVQNPSHIYTSAGTYTVMLTATNNGGSGSITKSGYITVTPGQTPASTIFLNSAAPKQGYLLSGGYIQFRVTGSYYTITHGGTVHTLVNGDIVRLTINSGGTQGTMYVTTGQISTFAFNDVDLTINGVDYGQNTISNIYIGSYDTFTSTLTLNVPSQLSWTNLVADGASIIPSTSDSHQITIYNLGMGSGGVNINSMTPYVYYTGGTTGYTLS